VELWFTEEWLPGLKLSVRVKSIVFSKKTRFQELAIYDTEQLGRILTLDNVIQTAEKDEYIYHESLVHVPLFAHPRPENVLIIGGGDGGSLRETVKHPEVKEAVLVDIDGDVIEASKAYLPGWNKGFSDHRARVIVGDGLAFVREAQNQYDVVIVDSTDPVGSGEGLFTDEFYTSIARVLRPGGLLAAQTENPLIMPEIVRGIYRRIAGAFPVAKLYTAPVPTYPGGWWSFTCASLGPDPEVPQRKPEGAWDLRYYSPEVHERAFVLSPGIKRDVTQEGR
jgi:spermidine synthase